MVVWVIGLSGAGKSTFASHLHRAWQAREAHTVLVDGDVIRALFGTNRDPADFTLVGRRDNAERVHALCRWLDGQGINVVASILLLFSEVSDANRAEFSAYHEIWIDAPLDQVEARDVKGLYARARAGLEPNVVGVDLPWSPPSAPDRVIGNTGPEPDWDALAGDVLTDLGVA